MILSLVACQTDFLGNEVGAKQRKVEANGEVVLPPIVEYVGDIESLYSLSLEYVNRNPEVLGNNVMVFRSYEQLEETLKDFDDMDVNSLRDWTNENGWTSDIIEANIFYDSILLEQYQIHGIEFVEDCYADSNQLDAAVSAFDIAYEQRPDYFVMHSNGESVVMDLLGELDESALYNDKNVFVVEGMVHKLCTDGGVVICPLDLYLECPVETTADVAYMTYCEQASAEQLSYVGVAGPYCNRFFSRKSIGGKCSTDIYFCVEEYTYFFFTDNYACVNVKNYCFNNKRGCYVLYRCRTQLDLVIYSGEITNKYVFEFHKNKKCRNITWRDHDLDWGYIDNQILSYDLYLETSDGVVIDVSE